MASDPICPKCKSNDIRKMGKHITLRGVKQRYMCNRGHTFYEPGDYADTKKRRKK